MGYTPVELRHVKVARSLLGYNRGKVEQLLDEVADSFEVVWRDRGELTDQVEDLQRQLGALQEREQLLSQTLVAAEAAAVEMREHARREAELIVAEAHNDARSVARNAQADRDRLVSEAKRVEGFLRAALGLVEQVGEAAPDEPEARVPEPESQTHAQAPQPTQDVEQALEPPAIWPRDERAETVDEALGLDVEPTQAQGPYLRRVAGEGRNFDWGD
jgi:cell division initiation protein